MPPAVPRWGRLERGLTVLEVVAAVSPLLGLLGTVLGMVQIFEAITAAGLGDPQVLAGGIGKALITTVAGLCVAIPALAAHSFLARRVDEYAIEMQNRATVFLVRLQTMRRAEEGGRRISAEPPVFFPAQFQLPANKCRAGIREKCSKRPLGACLFFELEIVPEHSHGEGGVILPRSLHCDADSGVGAGVKTQFVAPVAAAGRYRPRLERFYARARIV